MIPGKIIRLNDSSVRCPICKDFLIKKYDEHRRVFILVCEKYKVAIAVNDPFVNRWDEAEALSGEKGRIECPNCNSNMNCFFTSTGFLLAVCPKKSCGTTLRQAQPDRTKDEAPAVSPLLVDGIDRPVATPDKPGLVQ